MHSVESLRFHKGANEAQIGKKFVLKTEMELSELGEEDIGNRKTSVLERFSIRYREDMTEKTVYRHSMVFKRTENMSWNDV